MKLRNKKTGEIAEASVINFELVVRYDDGRVEKYPLLFDYSNFEYYEEPKGYWYMSNRGDIRFIDDEDTDWDNDRKQIGNYFETREEAETAAEKLKVWQRLKIKGAEFYGWRRNQTGTYELYLRWEDRIPRSYEVKKDLDLLFGGEE